MERWPLVDVVAAAHLEVEARLRALEGTAANERAAHLERLAETMHATAKAEEDVLFPALRQAAGDCVLVKTLAADHSEAAHRLETLALHPGGPGFESAFSALTRDVCHHMRDESDAVLPLIDEALGDERSADLAVEFRRALGAS